MKILWKKEQDGAIYYSVDTKNWIDDPSVWFGPLENYEIARYPEDIEKITEDETKYKPGSVPNVYHRV